MLCGNEIVSELMSKVKNNKLDLTEILIGFM